MSKALVIGSINVDFTLKGIDKFPQENEEVDVKEVAISAGGKSRNIAEMTAVLLGKDNVDFLGKIAKDPFGLYQLPIRSLKKAGVSTDNILFTKKGNVLPGMAFISVDVEGDNAIYVYEGANKELLIGDIKEFVNLIEETADTNGIIIISLEMPVNTASFIVELANKKDVRVVLEPGGVRETDDIGPLLNKKYFFIKPNHTEAEILTGIKVDDFDSAEEAGEKLLEIGAENVMITLGNKGSLFMNEDVSEKIHIQEFDLDDKNVNETGSGDQVMAAVSAYILKGYSPLEAARVAVVAGTLQYHKPNIQPVTQEELERYLEEDLKES